MDWRKVARKVPTAMLATLRPPFPRDNSRVKMLLSALHTSLEQHRYEVLIVETEMLEDRASIYKIDHKHVLNFVHCRNPLEAILSQSTAERSHGSGKPSGKACYHTGFLAPHCANRLDRLCGFDRMLQYQTFQDDQTLAWYARNLLQ